MTLNNRAALRGVAVVEDGSRARRAPVGWGLIGAGAIAREVIAPALHASSGAIIRRIAARDLARARSLQPEVAVTRYEEVLEDPCVEVVYISLHNSAHATWCSEALSRGKHVLCEKPLATTEAEVLALERQAREAGLLLVEALWMRWHPRMRELRTMAEAIILGGNAHVEAMFEAPPPPLGNYRGDPALGGGALLDLGGYVLGAILEIFGWESPAVRGVETQRWPAGADCAAQADLAFGLSRATASLRVSLDGALGNPGMQRFALSSDAGAMSCSAPVFTSRNEPSQVVCTGEGQRPTRHRYGPCDPYRMMLGAMSSAVRGEDAWLMPLSQSVAIARVMDAIRACS